MLKLPQRTLGRANLRQFSTLIQRNGKPTIKTTLSVATMTALKRQQPWKLAVCYGSKRFYAGKKKNKNLVYLHNL